MSESTSNSEMFYRTLGDTGESFRARGLAPSLKHVDEQLAGLFAQRSIVASPYG